MSAMPQPNRIACAALAAALHTSALMQLADAVRTPSQSLLQRPVPDARSLLVTAFMSEEQARSAPAFAALTGTDILPKPAAIVMPLPELPDIHPVAADAFEHSAQRVAMARTSTAESKRPGRALPFPFFRQASHLIRESRAKARPTAR